MIRRSRVYQGTDYLARIRRPVRLCMFPYLSTINWWDSLDTDIGGHIRLTVGLSGEFVSTSTLVSPHTRTPIRVWLIFGHHTIVNGHASGAESAAEEGFDTHRRCVQVFGSTMVIARGEVIPGDRLTNKDFPLWDLTF